MNSAHSNMKTGKALLILCFLGSFVLGGIPGWLDSL